MTDLIMWMVTLGFYIKRSIADAALDCLYLGVHAGDAVEDGDKC